MNSCYFMVTLGSECDTLFQLYDGVDKHFTKFFETGGRIVSFCSNFDQTICEIQTNVNPNKIKV